MHSKKHLKHNLLYLLIFIITLYGCGSDTTISSQSSDKNNEYGNATFGLKWESPQNSHDMSLRAKGEAISELSYAPIDCTASGVSTVSANVYDSGGTYITSGGPWNCSAHSGTITGISVGINRMIAVSGKDSSNRIIYNGQITGVTIDKDQTTDAGQITMNYVANDTTAPTDGTLSASAGNSQVSLSWSGWTDSGSGLGSYKLVYSTTSTPSSCSSGTQIYLGSGTSYTHTGLTNSTTYYYRVCATDNAGNISNGATASGTPASTGTTATTTTTTGSAPSAPTGVSASAGNGQTTISWSSVSGATSYNIYWSTTSGVTKTNGTKITGATSPYTHTGLTNGTTYYYVVTAVNSNGESSESSQVSTIPKKVFQVDTGGTLTTGLVAYYKLEDVNDFWSTNNLTNTGSVVFNAGKFNNAADFGASNTTQGLNSSNTLGIDGGVISISAWINITTTPGGSFKDDIYISQGNNTSRVGYQMDYINDSGTLKVYFGRNKYAVTVDSAAYTTTLTTGTWYHVVGTYDGTNLRLYLNNSLVAGPTASSGNGVNAYGGGMGIGASAANQNNASGKVDEVGIWNKVLSTTEISDLYNGGSGQTMQ